jgi:hypothetical protein
MRPSRVGPAGASSISGRETLPDSTGAHYDWASPNHRDGILIVDYRYLHGVAAGLST